MILFSRIRACPGYKGPIERRRADAHKFFLRQKATLMSRNTTNQNTTNRRNTRARSEKQTRLLARGKHERIAEAHMHLYAALRSAILTVMNGTSDDISFGIFQACPDVISNCFDLMERCEGGRLSGNITPATRKRVEMNGPKIYVALEALGRAFTGSRDLVDGIDDVEVDLTNPWFKLLRDAPQPFENVLDAVYGIETGTIFAHSIGLADDGPHSRKIEITRSLP